MPSAFIDSNVIIYAAAGERNDPRKAEIAREIIAGADFGISFQVLQEFFVSVRKAAANFSDEEADQWIAELLEFEVIEGGVDLFLAAVVTARRYRISYWDAAIVAAAERSGASILFTEDLNHDQLYGSVRAVNPFLER